MPNCFVLVLRVREDISPGSGAVSPYDTFNLWQLSILELEQATGNFNQINLVGEGSFGLVYKGLLGDGSTVAIKRCLHCPVQYFVNEVKLIAPGRLSFLSYFPIVSGYFLCFYYPFMYYLM